MAGQAYRQGVDAYVALHGDKAGGRKVEVVYRDSAGADPTLAKRLAEELIVKDKVAMLAGFYLSPEVAATAPVVNSAKVPLFIVNAATPGLLKMSPYFVRVGQSIHQPAELAASDARQQGKSRGYVAVADYGPGHVVEEAFSARFTAEGGQMTGNVRIPLNTADFAPFAERIANANPDVLQVFLPPGAAAVGFSKALAARGLTQKLLIIGQGEAEDGDLPQFDDSILGFKSILYVDATTKSPEGSALTEWLARNAGPNARPNSFNVGAYDTMHLVYKVLNDQAGKPFDSQAALKSIRGVQLQEPAGSGDRRPRDPRARAELLSARSRQVGRRQQAQPDHPGVGAGQANAREVSRSEHHRTPWPPLPSSSCMAFPTGWSSASSRSGWSSRWA